LALRAKNVALASGINSSLDQARSELQSEVGSRNIGGPPLDGALGAGHPPPVAQCRISVPKITDTT
jgi:hypothetical protein